MERNDTHTTVVEIPEVDLRDIMLKHIVNEYPDLRSLTKPGIEYLDVEKRPIEPGFKCVFIFNGGGRKKKL